MSISSKKLLVCTWMKIIWQRRGDDAQERRVWLFIWDWAPATILFYFFKNLHLKKWINKYSPNWNNSSILKKIDDMVISLVVCQFLWPRKSLHNAATFFIDPVCRKVRQHLVASVFIVTCHKWARQTLALRNGATARRNYRASGGWWFPSKNTPAARHLSEIPLLQKTKTKNKTEIIKTRSGVNDWLLWNCAILLPVSQRYQ